jgi:hypothetical protein
MKQLIESEVSIKSLIDIFNSAFIKVMDETNESFRVQGENLKIKIFIDEKRKYLKFSILYGLTGSITLSQAMPIVHKVNEENILIKFTVFEHEKEIFLECNYHMTYEEGLIAFHVIKISKKFEQYTVDALREYFQDYI